MAEYAKVIVDISQEKLDKTFEYRIPPYLTQRIAVGMQVYIPFGSRRITGYVVELSDEAEYDEDKLKNIAGIVTDSVPIESHLIALAGWMREHYGGTMNQALKMVLPIKEKKKAVEHKRVRLALHPVEAKNQLGAYERRHSTARARLLRALLEEEELEKLRDEDPHCEVVCHFCHTKYQFDLNKLVKKAVDKQNAPAEETE